MKYIFSCLLIINLCLIYSQAQDSSNVKVWSLNDCIEYAHAHNLHIKRQELQAEMAEEDLLQSKLQILPDINGSAYRTYSFGHQIDPTTNDFISDRTINDAFGIQSNVDLFTGLVNYNSIKKNELEMLAAIQNVEKEKVNISLEIAKAYLQILFNKELQQVANNQREVIELQVGRTEKLVQSGNAAKGDLLEMQAQLAAEDLNVTNALNNLKLSYLNLAQILDLEEPELFDVKFPDSVEVNTLAAIVDVDVVYQDAVTYLPHIKQASLNLDASEYDLKIQKGQLSPTVFLSGDWMSRYSDKDTLGYSDQFENYASKSFSFGVRVPIFNKGQKMNNISRAKIGVLDAEARYDQTHQQLLKEIQQAHNDAVSAADKYKSSSQAVESYSEAFKYTEKKFEVGIVNSVEYNISKNNYIKAQSELVQAKYQYIFSIKILDFYRGIPLSL